MDNTPVAKFWYFCVVCIDFMATHELILGVTILDFLLIGIAFEILTWVIGNVISAFSGPEVGESDDFVDIELRNSNDYGDHQVFTNIGKRGKYGRYIDY